MVQWISECGISQRAEIWKRKKNGVKGNERRVFVVETPLFEHTVGCVSVARQFSRLLYFRAGVTTIGSWMLAAK
jgi:hypothetical protein